MITWVRSVFAILVFTVAAVFLFLFLQVAYRLRWKGGMELGQRLAIQLVKVLSLLSGVAIPPDKTP